MFEEISRAREREDVPGARKAVRQDEVADEETPHGDAGIVENEVSHLAVHLLHRGLVHTGVVGGVRVPPGGRSSPYFMSGM